jgi:hypothetical protein
MAIWQLAMKLAESKWALWGSAVRLASTRLHPKRRGAELVCTTAMHQHNKKVYTEHRRWIYSEGEGVSEEVLELGV